jgi:hypothetical protein
MKRFDMYDRKESKEDQLKRIKGEIYERNFPLRMRLILLATSSLRKTLNLVNGLQGFKIDPVYSKIARAYEKDKI